MKIDLEARIRAWLERDPDSQTKQELQALIDSGCREELEQRFANRLAFGTAGLRGLVGAGPGRMNALVVRETSAGLGHYLLENVPNAAQRGIVIAYDGRPDSCRFARDTACVLAGLNIRVFLTGDVAATPLGAFGVKHLGAAAGVVVTASHNPPEYNGYKVYWENGAQIIPPHDAGIAQAIEAAALRDIPWQDFAKAQASGTVEILGPGFYQAYCDAIAGSPLLTTSADPTPVSVAYTAMHGVGADLAEGLLQQAGFTKIYSVASQREPDGHFPTVNFPNPEEPGAMDAVLALASQHGTTLACANDPDADRLAVAVNDGQGRYRMLSGDQVGVLLGYYLLQKPCDLTPIVCATIVSSSMLERIARDAGARFYQTLTGFKWLTNIAMAHEDQQQHFLFAYEEALGYAVGDCVRDKDGLSALLAFAQMTAHLASEGKSVLDQLEYLYRRFGLFLTRQQSTALQAGTPPIGDLLRANPPTEIAGSKVIMTEDIKTGVRRFADGRTETIDLFSSDVLVFRLANGGRVIVRPSGTEPKLKCYYEIVAQVAADEPFPAAEQRANLELDALVDTHQKELSSL